MDNIDMDNINNMDICIKMDKIDNLFTTIKQTPIHIIKSTLNKITNNIIEQIEKNELENDIYFGDINENLIQGHGILIKKNNIMIEGKFSSIDNIMNSNIHFDNVCVKGIIKNGELCSGTVFNDNIQIIGSFTNGLPDKTVKYYNNGISYEGQCKNGIIEGIGLYKDVNISYEGEWINNKFDGEGILITKDYTYNGTFYDGKKHGNGKILVEDKEYFIEYDNDIEINRLDYNEKKIEDLTEKINFLEINDQNNITIIKQQEDQIIEYNNRIKNIEKDKKQLEEQMNCKICFRKASNIVLHPCNHYAICEDCEISIRNSVQGKKCPICRKPYNRFTKIFIS